MNTKPMIVALGLLLATFMSARPVVAQSHFHLHYFSTDIPTGITIHLQAVEDAGCVHTDTCGWAIRWDPGLKVKTRWDTAEFDVAYLERSSLPIKHDRRVVLGSSKSAAQTLYPSFVIHPSSVVYIRVTLSGKGTVLARAEFQ